MSLFIEPKKKNEVPLNIKISHDSIVILQEYTDYTGYELGELINIISDKLLNDKGFVEYFKGKRSNKKIMAVYEKQKINQFGELIETDEETPF